MRFFALITLLALFLIQSQTAHADFMCNNAAHPLATTGYCAILSSEPANKQGPVYYVKPASPKFTVRGLLTCSGIRIFGAAPTKTWCCYRPPTPFSGSTSVDLVYKYTAGEVLYNCYTPPGK